MLLVWKHSTVERWAAEERLVRPRIALALARPPPGQGTKNNPFGTIVIPVIGSLVMAPEDMSTMPR